ncbi:MAG: hypothetical protein J7450_07875 [Thermomicrobium sp.]|uniref:hypothetical protein n=1 Tax=Thermomicrobium sp. TaxID=1969469 RepID=UPI001AFE8EEA|nr:hypothetical protein [Thermomicrobium sp.]MBO9359461.1 hypothetical protein [Thermomicrobium sp.]
MRQFAAAYLEEGYWLLPLQSPEGDWADCDDFLGDGERILEKKLLQSPEGDWADCDGFSGEESLYRLSFSLVAIP